MIKYTKRELEKLGFKFIDRDHLGIDIVFQGWTDNARRTLRVYINCVHDVDHLVIARPGLGGTFNLSYDYIAQFPVKNYGQSRIVKEMKESQTAFNRFYKTSPKYAAYVARAIELAKYSLLTNER